MSSFNQPSDAYQRRVDDVRDRVDIVDVVRRVVKLGKGSKPRGKCPFHGSKSDSFMVDASAGRARCWGCDWYGDAIKFVMDHYGLGFRDAVDRLAGEQGLDGLTAQPAKREKIERRAPEREMISSQAMGAWMWRRGRRDVDALRTYLGGRGVPEAVLSAERLDQLRFMPSAPIAAWAVNRKPRDVPQAPAMMAVVRRPYPGRPGEWMPIGLHVTYLSDDLTGKMSRQRQDGSDYPARKMLGSVSGGAVLLGRYRADAPLYVGEGIETVLSGMALMEAKAGDIGLAALSLGNLQGRAILQRGALPIYNPDCDPEAMMLAFNHAGAVTGLIDADMKPLPGPRDQRSGQFRGVEVIERRHHPAVRRTITTAERATLCATLFCKAWRRAGAGYVDAVRPHMGMDFNDMARAK